MWRIGLLVAPVMGLVCSSLTTVGQESKHFRVEPDNRYQSITLDYSISTGICYLAQGGQPEPVAVYSARDIDDFNHSFNRQLDGSNLNVELTLDEKNTESFSQSISNKVFAKTKPEDNVWKVKLAENVSYNLNLTYGIGEAYIDLSGLSVASLKVKTGSADVNIGYLSNIPNKVPMASMEIKVDLGNVNVRQLYLAGVRNINAEVGFGNMLLDLAEPMAEPCQVHASVGAGTLEILIPKEGVPVIIKVKESMLCDVRLTKSFTETADNVFTNAAYSPSAKDVLEFAVDVSFGTIIFKEKR